jgi:hypothetical protein
VVPSIATPRHRDRPLPSYARPLIFRTTRHARGGRTPRVERRGLSDFTLSWLHTCRGAIGNSLRSSSFYLCRTLLHLPQETPRRTCPPRYRLNPDSATAQRAASMTTRLQDLLGTDLLVTTALNLLSNSLAPATCANYDNNLRRFSICVLS